MVKDKGNMRKYTEKDATLVLCQETEFNLSTVATESEEFEDIPMTTPKISKFSEVKLCCKFLIQKTQKKLDDDQETRMQSIYEGDSTQFGKGISNLPNLADGVQAIAEDAIEDVVDEVIIPRSNLK